MRRDEFGIVDKMVEDAYNKGYQEALEVVGKSDKYRWHDLRKNPKDLPLRAIAITGERTCHASDEVLAYDGLRYFITEYNHDSGEWVETTEYMALEENRIIAWREIEPFEEEE